jgi:hypothetical protein
MDVSILKQACCEFRNTFLKIGGIDVFQESITIASACNKVFRKQFLKPNSIGLVPKGGYRKADKLSRKALLWMKYLEMNYPFHIRHAGNGREYRLPELPNLKVDGFCDETMQVFSFNGCFLNGHECLRNRDVPIMGSTSETLESKYNQTVARLDKIVSAGYVCHVMWECEFDKVLKENPALLECDKDEPLILRNSLYGGRTEASKLYYKTDDMTKIKYYDIMSLCPYICKYFKFPIGHPKVNVRNNCANIKEMIRKEGVIKCRMSKQRTISSCITVQISQQADFRPLSHMCRRRNKHGVKHDEREREYVGTWVIDEVRKAVPDGLRDRGNL